jgi:uncharacterized protein
MRFSPACTLALALLTGSAWAQSVTPAERYRPPPAPWAGQPRAEPGPSFPCAKVRKGSMADMVCHDASLAALDRELAAVYAQALNKVTRERPPVLKATQRGWAKGRDDCWKAADPRDCVDATYRRRTIELQARYALVQATGPVRYACGGNAANEVAATFYATDPPSLIAERGDSVSWMVQERSASGTRYVGRNEQLWEHQGEATITWGYGAPELRCQRKP